MTSEDGQTHAADGAIRDTGLERLPLSMDENQQTSANTPFDTIESAQEFIGLLQNEVLSAHEEIGNLLTECDASQARRAEALQLVQYKLSLLSSHIEASQRVLHDLRTLRRLLLPG